MLNRNSLIFIHDALETAQVLLRSALIQEDCEDAVIVLEEAVVEVAELEAYLVEKGLLTR